MPTLSTSVFGASMAVRPRQLADHVEALLVCRLAALHVQID
jgi:hypothetical protein